MLNTSGHSSPCSGSLQTATSLGDEFTDRRVVQLKTIINGRGLLGVFALKHTLTVGSVCCVESVSLHYEARFGLSGLTSGLPPGFRLTSYRVNQHGSIIKVCFKIAGAQLTDLSCVFVFFSFYETGIVN